MKSWIVVLLRLQTVSGSLCWLGSVLNDAAAEQFDVNVGASSLDTKPSPYMCVLFCADPLSHLSSIHYPNHLSSYGSRSCWSHLATRVTWTRDWSPGPVAVRRQCCCLIYLHLSSVNWNLETWSDFFSLCFKLSCEAAAGFWGGPVLSERTIKALILILLQASERKEEEGGVEQKIKQKKKRSEALTFTLSPVETTEDLRLYRLEEVHIRVSFLFSPPHHKPPPTSVLDLWHAAEQRRIVGKKSAGTPAWSHSCQTEILQSELRRRVLT